VECCYYCPCVSRLFALRTCPASRHAHHDTVQHNAMQQVPGRAIIIVLSVVVPVEGRLDSHSFLLDSRFLALTQKVQFPSHTPSSQDMRQLAHPTCLPGLRCTQRNRNTWEIICDASNAAINTSPLGSRGGEGLFATDHCSRSGLMRCCHCGGAQLSLDGGLF